MHSVHFIRKPLNLGGVLGGFAVPNCKKIRCSCTEFGADSVQFAHFLHNSGGKTPILSRFRKLSPCAENSVHSVHSHQAQNPRASRAGHTPLPLLPEEPCRCTHLAPEGTLPHPRMPEAMPMHRTHTGGHTLLTSSYGLFPRDSRTDAGGFGAGLHSRKLRRREGQVRRCAGGGSLRSGGGTGARAGDGGA